VSAAWGKDQASNDDNQGGSSLIGVCPTIVVTGLPVHWAMMLTTRTEFRSILCKRSKNALRDVRVLTIPQILTHVLLNRPAQGITGCAIGRQCLFRALLILDGVPAG